MRVSEDLRRSPRNRREEAEREDESGMSTSITKRLERLESEPVFASRLFQSTYDGDCPVCIAHNYAIAAVHRWEQEHGIYVELTPENTMVIECAACGHGHNENRYNYTEAERDILRSHENTSDEKFDVVEAHGFKLWGYKTFWERCNVYWAAYKELTGVDPRHERGR
jgi:hypothetical protein